MSERNEWGPARLRTTRDLTPDIRLFEIEPERGFEPPTPGSHLPLLLTIHGRPDTRTYSVVGPCRDGVYRIAVKRLDDGRGGSTAMWGLAPGAMLTVAPPQNRFELRHGQPRYTLVAGGIGITPIYSMAMHLAEIGAPVRLLYAARRRADLAFADELRARLGDGLHVFLSEDGRRIDFAQVIDALEPGAELYVCGPIGMMEAAKRAWHDSGRPVADLRFETFGSGGHLPSLPFTVRIPHLGREVPVPVDLSMLEALEQAGIDVMSDCRRGECGLCALTILSADGPVDHRDVFFSDEEKAENCKLCACVSRVAGGSITVETGGRLR
ncbi:MAG: oxidoreductase [Acetobacteraceae bacterium]|nr:oxidoreductase [Acetobacteraceae bacterium]